MLVFLPTSPYEISMLKVFILCRCPPISGLHDTSHQSWIVSNTDVVPMRKLQKSLLVPFPLLPLLISHDELPTLLLGHCWYFFLLSSYFLVLELFLQSFIKCFLFAKFVRTKFIFFDNVGTSISAELVIANRTLFDETIVHFTSWRWEYFPARTFNLTLIHRPRLLRLNYFKSAMCYIERLK